MTFPRYRGRRAAWALIVALGACTTAGTPPVAVHETTTTPQAGGGPAPQQLTFPQEPFRRQQPPPDAVRPFRAPAVTTFKLDNGIQVYLVPRAEPPVVAMDLVFDGGRIDDPPGKEGLAAVCIELLGKGTRALDKIAYEEQLADLGSEITTYVGVDQIGVALRSLSRNLPESLALWTDTMLRPGMRSAEFERLMARMKTRLLEQRASPQGVATRIAPSLVFGRDHPHGRVVTEASLADLRLEDSRRYVTQRLRPRGAKLFVVGHISAKALKQRLQRAFFGWYGPATPGHRLPPADAPEGRVFFVDIPGAQQAVVQLLHLGPPRQAPDHLATETMAGILGGDFSSRINMNIRERHGYSYGASGRFYYTKTSGYFRAQSAVRSDVAGATVREMFHEIVQIKTDLVSADELRREVEGTILALPARFARGASIIGTYRRLVYHGLPLSYYDTFVARLQAVTATDLQAAASKHLKPDEIKVLVVGDDQTVRGQLRSLLADGVLPAGAFVRLDRDGNVLESP